MKTKPLGNYALIEIQREYEGVSRTDENESMQSGKLIEVSCTTYHLTASAAIKMDNDFIALLSESFKEMIGKTVRWEEFAEGGQTFEEDGKKYALIPWWRLISVTDNKES